MNNKDKRLMVLYLSIFVILASIGSYLTLIIKEKKM